MNWKLRMAGPALLLGLLMFVYGCGKSDQPEAGGTAFRGSFGGSQVGSLPVKVDTVQTGTISTYILTNTTLEAERTVDVIARVSGIVQDFNYEEGSLVKKGDLLAKLDDREMKLNMEQAKARADNTLRLFDRSKEMFEKNLVSKEQFDDAKYQDETAQSQYESARLQWQYTSIIAPIDGIVTSRLIELGDYITVNRVVFSIADYDTLRARIYIPERDISKIRVNQQAKITVEAHADKEFAGRVQMINPVVDPSSGTVKVTVEITRQTSGLLPGMFAAVFLLTDTHENTLIVPKRSLVLESETDRVFVYENGTAALRDIKIGFTESENMEIVDGLHAGDLVISVGQEGLRDGASVRLVGSQPTTDIAMADNRESAGHQAPANDRPGGRQGQMEGRGQRGQGGFQTSPERMKQMAERMLENPEIRKEYDKRVKEDPDFENNEEKKAEFFREMFQKMRQQRMGGQ